MVAKRRFPFLLNMALDIADLA